MAKIERKYMAHFVEVGDEYIRLGQDLEEFSPELAAQVETIADEHHLTDDASTVPEDERSLGKREDHDALPDEVKAKYVENLSLLQRMRELHLRLRSLSLENSTCPDSERYPFLKELIALDKKLHANWEAYDHYVASAPKATPKAATRKKKSAK